MRALVDELPISPLAGHDGLMRWAALFADLEAQAAVLEQAERAAEVDERTRGEVGALRLRDRARAAIGTPVRVRATGGVTAAGELLRVGPDWLLVDEGGGRELVVATAHLLSLRGLGRYSAVPNTEGVVESRLGLRHALRGIARDRSAVRVHLTDGSTVDATIDRVGADFLEVATHGAGEVRRRSDVRDVELIPLAAIGAVRRSV
ncbi:MAG: hypothetical protein QOC66_1830 [Pseudonocardiales bacterium]|jgi:hypothetical protein|nr:hypothetical protein [Pseudonocardiales bacterium]